MGPEVRLADHETTEEQDTKFRRKPIDIIGDLAEVLVVGLLDQVGGRRELDRRIAGDGAVGRITDNLRYFRKIIIDLCEVNKLHRNAAGDGPCEHGRLGVHLVVALGVVAVGLARDELVDELPRTWAAERLVVVVGPEVVKLTRHVGQICDDAAVPVVLEAHVFHELVVVQFHFEMDEPALQGSADVVGDGPVGVEVASGDDYDLIVQLVQADHTVEYEFIPCVQLRSLISARSLMNCYIFLCRADYINPHSITCLGDYHFDPLGSTSYSGLAVGHLGD